MYEVDDPDLLMNRSVTQRFVVAVAGIVVNVITAFSLDLVEVSKA